jgi:hypothetical protein
MNKNITKPSAPLPPATLEGWHAKRISKKVPRLNDAVETIFDAKWLEPDFYRWFTSTWDAEAVEGSSRADQYRAAMDIRDYAEAHEGFDIVKNAPLEALYKSITAVRKKHNESIRQRRGSAAMSPMAEADDDDGDYGAPDPDNSH